jgi:arylsulfatase
MKLVSEGQGGAWELYDLSRNRGESKDLAAEQPDRARELEQLWQTKLSEFRALEK